MWKPFLLVSAFIPALATAGEEESKAVLFSAQVFVAADGRATVSDLVGPKGALAQIVLDQLAEVRFVPARSEGKPVAAGVPLHGRVILKPAGDDYAVSLDSVTTRPVWKQGRPPDYPPDRLRANEPYGVVEARIGISAEGRVADVVIVSSTHRSYAEAVRRVAPQWRFESSAGTTVVVPVIFRDQTSRAATDAKPSFACAQDDARPNVVGDTGCTDRVEVFGLRVKRY